MPGSRVLRKIAPEAARFLGAAYRYRANPVAAARRFWSLYRQRRFSPDEIHFFRLLDPSMSDADLVSVVSKEELLAVQRQLNPPELHALTEDKLRFHQRCREAGLPTPAVLAVYAPDGTSSPGIPVLRNEADLGGFLDALPRSACILKPVGGVHGEGVTRLTREDGAWKSHPGEITGHAAIGAAIANSRYDRWMLQALVPGHPELSRLSGTDGLQTVRVVTIADSTDGVRILAARLRLICGPTAHDNFDYGRTGNLIAILDVDQGVIRSVVGGRGDPSVICQVTHHPRTGQPLLGYRVPQWAALRTLACEAAKAFLPLRTIGWDIAITDEEPCLIEGNVTWDTLSGDPRMGEIFRSLQSQVAEGR